MEKATEEATEFFNLYDEDETPLYSIQLQELRDRAEKEGIRSGKMIAKIIDERYENHGEFPAYMDVTDEPAKPRS